MSLTKPRVTQIDTTDIDSTEFASKTQINSVSSNLSTFASYANATFSTGGDGIATGNGVLFSDSFTTTNVSTNQFTLSANSSYAPNMLVYINGLLQHPDAYVVSGTTLTLINSDPLPSGLKVSVRELSVAGGVANVALANVSEARSSNAANGTLTFDYEGANLYVYDGSAVGGYFLPLTQAVLPVPEGTQAQGSVSGYASGGDSGSLVFFNVIQKFSFTANGNATDVGDLTITRGRPAGQSSTASGYTSGGLGYSGGFLYYNTIDKFSFSVDGNATDVGDLTQVRFSTSGQSSTDSGYTSGGASTIPSNYLNIIDKFPFSSNANATDVGDLTVARISSAGQSSDTNGYTSGGITAPTYSNVIDKFPFASNANATDVGDLSIINALPAGQNSSISGYISGGLTPAVVNVIQKFPFATNANTTDVGDLTLARYAATGQSSTASGYTSGGYAPTKTDTVDKFPFSTDGNATDVGNLLMAAATVAGQQV
jgi:hypothetical protein